MFFISHSENGMIEFCDFQSVPFLWHWCSCSVIYLIVTNNVRMTKTIWMVIDTTMLCAAHTCKENRKNLILMHFNNPKFIYLPKIETIVSFGLALISTESRKNADTKESWKQIICVTYTFSATECWFVGFEWRKRKKNIRDTHKESECYRWDCWHYIDTSISIVI